MKIVTTGLRFPEGPIAMPDGSVLLVEIERETLSRVTPAGKIEVVAAIPGGPNGAALGPDGRVYVCNNGGFSWDRGEGTLRVTVQSPTYRGGAIEAVDLKTGRVERLYSECNGHQLKGPNDIVFDADGNFWFTDLGKRRPRDMDRGFVFWARPDGSEIKEVIAPMISPNGIGLSPDGKTLYVAETETARLWAFEVTGPGEVRKRPWPESVHGGRLVLGMGGSTRLDSLAVASSGNICVAALEQRGVAEISPDGKLVKLHHVPDLLITNICFGGPDLRTAYVTMSHTGQLAALPWHESGLKLNFS
jgi:gluconolactonase